MMTENAGCIVRPLQWSGRGHSLSLSLTGVLYISETYSGQQGDSAADSEVVTKPVSLRRNGPPPSTHGHGRYL